MSASLGDSIELRVPSKPEYVAIVRALITDVARRVALPASAVEDVQVAASEACANVVRHAYGDQNGHEAGITIRCTSHNGRLVIEVADRGRGFSHRRIEYKPRRECDGGFGLILMRNLMDDVSLDSSPDEGTVVRMVKMVSRAASP